jgi:hypothetical protein
VGTPKLSPASIHLEWVRFKANFIHSRSPLYISLCVCADSLLRGSAVCRELNHKYGMNYGSIYLIKKIRCLSPLAKYTDRATAAYQRS